MTLEVVKEARGPESKARPPWRTVLAKRFTVVVLLLAAECVFFGVTQNAFLTGQNIENILTSVAILWVVSMGLTFVMLVGGFDLSLGAILQLTGIFIGAVFLDMALPGGVVFVLALLFGAALGGLVNGFFIGKLGLSFLMVTLGTLSLFQGVSLVWSNAETRGVASAFFDGMAFDKLFGISILIWIMALTLLVSLYLLRASYFGRDIYAVGGNPDAARLSGIRVERTIMCAYALAGLCAALASAIQVGRISAASPQVGGTVLFAAAAAVLLGGTSFAGGVGGVGGTAIGVLFMGVLNNGLALAGVAADWQYVVTGTILLLAVLTDMLQQPDGWRKLGIGRSPRAAPAASGNGARSP
jgi:ribose/xylose/arabinose/galactoside ABC-type transport system permease subunit